MQAIQGLYNNGTVRLNQQAPVKQGKIIVIFTDAEPEPADKMSRKEALHIFHKYAGSLTRDVNIKAELMEALDERYENIN